MYFCRQIGFKRSATHLFVYKNKTNKSLSTNYDFLPVFKNVFNNIGVQLCLFVLTKFQCKSLDTEN